MSRSLRSPAAKKSVLDVLWDCENRITYQIHCSVPIRCVKRPAPFSTSQTVKSVKSGPKRGNTPGALSTCLVHHPLEWFPNVPALSELVTTIFTPHNIGVLKDSYSRR